MRTTLDISDPLFKRAKMSAVEHGMTLKDLVAEAMEKYLAAPAATPAKKKDPPWMDCAGMLREEDADAIMRVVDDADFSKVDEEAWK